MAAVVTKESQGLRDERGQAFVLVVASLVVLLGMAALGIDVGSWYKAQRHDQAVADAAALAGSTCTSSSRPTARTWARRPDA